jgi:hypothetical protein
MRNVPWSGRRDNYMKGELDPTPKRVQVAKINHEYRYSTP